MWHALKCAEMVLYGWQNAFASTNKFYSQQLAVPAVSHDFNSRAFAFAVGALPVKVLCVSPEAFLESSWD